MYPNRGYTVFCSMDKKIDRHNKIDYLCKMLDPVQILVETGMAIHVGCYDGIADSVIIYWNFYTLNWWKE